mmetsp:Transcript_59688/g.132918  ORF Transcript_59688/g.132918 Transcript_59688/m.132918 type:complete len:80 (-) Transcript_59688:553-792(-)
MRRSAHLVPGALRSLNRLMSASGSSSLTLCVWLTLRLGLLLCVLHMRTPATEETRRATSNAGLLRRPVDADDGGAWGEW